MLLDILSWVDDYNYHMNSVDLANQHRQPVGSCGALNIVVIGIMVGAAVRLYYSLSKFSSPVGVLLSG
jgi:hypothetical protein